ncbi:MAG: CRTAC1 family protein [bacterium]
MNQTPKTVITLLGLAVFLSACGKPASTPRETGFHDITAETGINFVHTDGSSGRHYLVETVTAGLGLFDYDNDGSLDIYFANGAELPGRTFTTPPANELWRNGGNLRFTNVTREAGVGDTGYSMGCVMGDIDNDGDLDIYVSNFREDVLYRNNGDGTFTDVTKAAGLGDPRLGAGACMADFNQDGRLDLFVANYIECPLDTPAPCTRMGVPVYCDPSTWNMYEPQQASLYFNNGDGTFRNVSQESGIAQYRGRGMGVSCTDYDNDGDQDIYIANDVTENFLYRNQGDGTFQETALFAGVAYDLHGHEQGSMGCDFGDYDGDGWFDLIVTSYQNQPNTLYHSLRDGTFEDVTIPSGVIAGSMENVSWATFFFDYDNDSLPDLFIANGHLQDNIEKIEPQTKYESPNQLFRNNGHGTFTDVSAQAGPGFQVRRSTRGGTFGDLDNDGDLDIVVSNSRREPTVLLNELRNGNHWINIRLEGVKSNRDGIGARVEVTAGGKKQMNEVRAGSSYQSHYDLRLHFGLGKAETIDQIRVAWPSGQVDTLPNVKADHFVKIKENAGYTVLR